MPKKYTIEEIADYISGWAMGEYGEVEKIGAYVLKNALSQLEDEQDGIEAVLDRKAYYEKDKQKIDRELLLDYLIKNCTSIGFNNSRNHEYCIENGKDLMDAVLQEIYDKEEQEEQNERY